MSQNEPKGGVGLHAHWRQEVVDNLAYLSIKTGRPKVPYRVRRAYQPA
jgi:hypothetical protein